MMLRGDYRLPTCHLGPPLSIAYEGYGARGYPSHHSEGVSGNALSQQFSDVNHLLAGQFATRLALTLKIHKADLPLVLSVSGKADPLKVFDSVVEFVAVNVVDSEAISIARDKCDSYESMQKVLDAEPIVFRRNLKVSVLRYKWCRKALGYGRLHLLRLAVPSARVNTGVRRRLHSAIRTNKQFNAL